MNRGLIAIVAGFAGLLFVAATARADYCRTDKCPAPSTKLHTQCCQNPSGPPSGAEACGEVSVGAVNVIGGCASPSSQGGCINEFNSSGGSCGTEAVDACIACGCATDTGC
jgi:hypothetical protein